jgi:hypothetical protein
MVVYLTVARSGGFAGAVGNFSMAIYAVSALFACA